MVVERTRRINVLVTDEELEMLRKLADSKGVTISDYIRLGARDAYAKLTETTVTTSPRPKRKKGH